MSHKTPGRLSRPPNPVLFELLYEPGFAQDRVHVLPFLLRIDAAHVVMLAERRLLATATASRLLTVNRELAAPRHGGGPAPGPVRAQLERLRGRLSALTDALDARRRQYRSADAELDRAVEAVQGEKP